MTASARIESYEDVLRFQISALAERFQASSGIPGVCIAVSTTHGTVEVARGVRSTRTMDPIETGAGFRMRCIAKLLLAIVALEQAQQGKLSLNAALGGTLDELSGSVHGRDVTLVHLLSHTAGYRSFPLPASATASLDWARFIAELRTSPRLFQPGTVFNYEHTGAVLAAEVLQRATGEPFLTLLADLFSRLHLAPVALPGSHTGAGHAGGHYFDVRSQQYVPMERPQALQDAPRLSQDFWGPSLSDITLTVGELAKLGRQLCGFVEDPFEEPPIPASVRGLLLKPLVHLPPFLTTPGIATELPIGFSLGAAQYGDGWHGLTSFGPGQCIALRYSPSLQIAVAAGLNVGQPHAAQQIACAAGLVSAGNASSIAPARTHPRFTPLDVEGLYDDGGSRRCEVSSDGSVLTCQFQGGADRMSVVEICLDSDPMTLSSSIPRAAISFLLDTDGGTATGLMLGMNAYRRTPPAG